MRPALPPNRPLNPPVWADGVSLDSCHRLSDAVSTAVAPPPRADVILDRRSGSPDFVTRCLGYLGNSLQKSVVH
jgi:hypothetical protein